MSRTSISVEQFGPLYHGTNVPGLSTIDQAAGGGPKYARMQNSYGYNYATTGLQTAINYSRWASGETLSGGNWHKQPGHPTVYEVQPQRKGDSWGPDPDSGPNGFHDGPRSKREALDIANAGDGEGRAGDVSLRFRSPLKVQREVWVEDKAKDVTNGGFQDRPIYGGGSLSDYHTYGRSFS